MTAVLLKLARWCANCDALTDLQHCPWCGAECHWAAGKWFNREEGKWASITRSVVS